MTRSVRSSLLAVACAVSMAPTLLSAQVVASTFGPGDSYNNTNGWLVGPTQSIDQASGYDLKRS